MTRLMLSTCLIALGFFAALSLSVELEAANPQDLNSPFTLESLEDDNSAMLRYKAALRLFAGVGAVRQFCDRCSNEKAWTQYEKRNGTTIGYVVGQFKLGPGFGDAQKAAVSDYVDYLVTDAFSNSNCDAIIHEVNKQGWDLYKGERFLEDYSLVRSKAK